MKIRAIIIDDEQNSRELINSICETYYNQNIAILDQCNSVDSGIISIEKHNPDLIFLDVDMPNKYGFELVKHFLNKSFEIVFITGHANHYIDAIKCSAFEYIMKPVNPLNIKSVIERFENKQVVPNFNQFQILIDNLKTNYDKLIISTTLGFNTISINSILYCKADESYCHIVTNEESILASKSLKEIESLLPKKQFLRVSKSNLININSVKKFITNTFELEMSNGNLVQVSSKLFTKKQLMDALSL